MKLFRRRSRPMDQDLDEARGDERDDRDLELGEVAELEDDASDDEVAEPVEPPMDRVNGPWDLSEKPSTADYVDLGGIRLQGRDGMELRLELDEATGAVSSATVTLGSSAVQLQAFAAPRSTGIWAEIRAEITAGIERQGGKVDEIPGLFGRELLARIPARSPDGRTGHTAARFVGIDGPRWFLRAVFHGEAVHDEAAAVDLENVVRGVVVVRGSEAMAPRELLALHLPGSEPAAEPSAADELRPFQRGPEITEVR